MSLKDRISRNFRANLNELLDKVSEFEEQGGFRKYVGPIVDELGIDDSFEPPPKGEKTIREVMSPLGERRRLRYERHRCTA